VGPGLVESVGTRSGRVWLDQVRSGLEGPGLEGPGLEGPGLEGPGLFGSEGLLGLREQSW
jgi:hypothetical protein